MWFKMDEDIINSQNQKATIFANYEYLNRQYMGLMQIFIYNKNNQLAIMCNPYVRARVMREVIISDN